MSLTSSSPIDRVAGPGPILVVGRGQSGTRCLAEALQKQGVFIGQNLNHMLDSLTWGAFVEQVVLNIYPQYDRLQAGDVWHRLLQSTTQRFQDEGYSSGPWGWKIGISAFVI